MMDKIFTVVILMFLAVPSFADDDDTVRAVWTGRYEIGPYGYHCEYYRPDIGRGTTWWFWFAYGCPATIIHDHE